MGVGMVVFLTGLFIDPARAWGNYLIALFYLLSLGVGAASFIALQSASNAGFGVAYRRIPEAVTRVIPVAGVGAIVLFFGIDALYEWSHASVVAEDPILQGKQAYLNVPFFILRIFVYFAIWVWLSHLLVTNSREQDRDPDLIYTRRNVRNGVLFILLGGLAFIFASIDLLMSLEPHWYSTVFGLMTIAGMFLCGLAGVTIVMIILRHNGFGSVFTTKHLSGMGKWMLAMSVFWVYLWVSQHLLIWYSNIPEETSYYVFRHFDSWGSLSFLNLILNWLIPFLVLLPQATKRDDTTMLYVSVVILLGHWLDLYIRVMPTIFGENPLFGLPELGSYTGMMALFFWVTLRSFSRYNPVPLNDPYLVESLPAVGRV